MGALIVAATVRDAALFRTLLASPFQRGGGPRSGGRDKISNFNGYVLLEAGEYQKADYGGDGYATIGYTRLRLD